MGAGSAASHHKVQAQPTNTSTTKPKRRKCREVTISSSAAPPQVDPDPDPDTNVLSGIFTNTLQAPLNLKDQLSHTSRPAPPPPPMEFSGSPSNGVHTFPSGFTKFNSALTAGLLNPMSPPPQTSPVARSSPTLFEMMANEPDCLPRGAQSQPPPPPVTAAKVAMAHQNNVSSAKDKKLTRQQRISEMLGEWSPGNPFNDPDSSDIKLTLTEKDGFNVSLDVHRQILVANSVFFAGRLSERWTKQQRAAGVAFEVEISDCEDVEVYVETLRLMYCKDLKRMLIKEDVPKVLGILKISVAIGFDAGVSSCLEYLEAAPWAEDDEEKVTSLLSELRLEGAGASDVLKRVSRDVNSTIDGNGNENGEVLIKLLHVVLEGKDEKARREMKGLFSKMLRENANHNELRKESLYSACDGCLQQLRHHFLQAANSDHLNVSQIARHADNLHWILDILIDRQMAEGFLKIWASQTELSNAHPKVPSVHRFEVSRVTARLFVGVGKGQLLASKDSRYLLLKTWLVPFYDDFGWIRRASKQGLDRHLIEDGLSNTILTLPLSWQQEILMAWFDRFLNSGEDCPNLQRGFEAWWRRAFWKRNGEDDGPRLRVAGNENSWS